MTYIKIADCKHGWTYEVHSRNLTLGVFNAETKGFVGLRSKWGDEYLFTEYHWDTGAPHGTAKPRKEIEECPIKDLRERFDTICFRCNRAVHFVQNDKNGKGSGDWMHVDDPGNCEKNLNKNGNFGSPQNDLLFKYLSEVSKRHPSSE